MDTESVIVKCFNCGDWAHWVAVLGCLSAMHVEDHPYCTSCVEKLRKTLDEGHLLCVQCYLTAGHDWPAPKIEEMLVEAL